MKIINLSEIHFNCSEITAASSLIQVNHRIFSVCDDQYGLYELKQDSNWIHNQNETSPELPKDPKALKKLKPDYEALLASVDNKFLYLIPSGSKPNRTQVVSFNLLNNSFESINFNPFYQNLVSSLPLINIEGAALFQENYLFMNRGISKNKSSLIAVNSKSLKIEKILELDLGLMENVYLHGSELSIHENFLYILAVAEDSYNSYDDGKIIGSSLVKLSLDNFEIIEQWYFNLPIKVEGLCRWNDLWLTCTDPDGEGNSQFYTFSI